MQIRLSENFKTKFPNLWYNNKALALHSRAKRHAKTEKQGNNKEWDKTESKERVSQNRHTKAEKQRKNNE